MTDGATLLHSKSQLVTREQLAQYIPPPATETFKPVAHAELVDTLTRVMQDRGLFIRKSSLRYRAPSSLAPSISIG